jgi:hypothetical protein
MLFTGASVAGSGIREISFEPGSPFRLSGGAVVDADEATLVRAVGESPSVTVADSITVLGLSAFEGSPWLTEVFFGSRSRLREMRDAVFRDCARLQSIRVPATVKLIGGDCFRACPALRELAFCADSALSHLFDGALAHCTGLVAIALPASLEYIGPRCFFECHALAAVGFAPDAKLARIQEMAFARCESLPALCLPAAVERLDMDAFWESPSLALTFAGPARVAELRSLPPAAHPVDVPDSVELLEFSEDPAPRFVSFGRESRLMKFKTGGVCRGFVQVSTQFLKRRRRALEFRADREAGIRPRDWLRRKMAAGAPPFMRI